MSFLPSASVVIAPWIPPTPQIQIKEDVGNAEVEVASSHLHEVICLKSELRLWVYGYKWSRGSWVMGACLKLLTAFFSGRCLHSPCVSTGTSFIPHRRHYMRHIRTHAFLTGSRDGANLVSEPELALARANKHRAEHALMGEFNPTRLLYGKTFRSKRQPFFHVIFICQPHPLPVPPPLHF